MDDFGVGSAYIFGYFGDYMDRKPVQKSYI